jgi:cell division protease FtsH
MVCEWGMDSEVGPVSYGQEDEPIFIGKEIARHKDYSEETARALDAAVKRILDGAREKARIILNENKEKLERLADSLLSRETLSDSEVRVLIDFPAK